MIKYESYKSSGIEWLGDIPSHWDVKKIGQSFFERKEKVSDKDFAPLSVTKKGVVPQLDNAAKSSAGDDRKKVLKGDFVINSRSDRKGSSGVSLLDGSVSLISIVLEPKGLNSKYIHNLLRSYEFTEEFYRNGQGIVADLWSTKYSLMKSIYIPIPPKKEQEAIANFLDKKLEQVDNYISKQKELIKLLKEKKNSLINQAVTKGLDPKVEYKESGIEWLGKIPKHWEVKKLKYLVKNLNNKRIPLESTVRGKMKKQLYDYYGATGIIDKVDNYIFDEPTIIIAEDGANLVMRNLKLVYLADGKYWVNNHAHILKVNSCHVREYIAHVLESYDYKPLISGSAQPKLTKERFMNIEIVFPSKKEQQQIVEYIEKESSKIDKVISTKEDEIKLLDEYKQSLISSAVTGKIKVS